MTAGCVPVDEIEDRPGKKRTEDGLQTQSLGKGHEGHEQQDSDAHPDLGGGVLKPDQHGLEAHRPAEAGERQGRDDHGDQEPAEQQQLGARARRLRGEEQGKQHHRPEVGQRRRGDGLLTEVGVGLAGILQDGHDEAERSSREGDGQEKRRADPAGEAEGETGDESERQAEDESDGGEAEQAPPQSLDVDLQAGQEQEERQSEQGEDLDGQVDLDPAEPVRADRDPGHDLQDDRRHPDPREQAHGHGGGDGDGGHDDEARERDGGHHL